MGLSKILRNTERSSFIKRVLITQILLKDYSGSEIVTFSLASYFSSIGAEVLIYTGDYNKTMQNEVSKIPNVRITKDENETNSYILSGIEIAWIQHSLIPSEIFNNYKNIFIVFNHMSSFLKIEAPLFGHIEHTVADKILFMSPEAKDLTLKLDYFQKNPENLIEVFDNPAPDNFYEYRNKSKSKKTLEKIAVVSNHITDDMHNVINRLKENNIEVTVYGVNGIRVLITPEILSNYDCIISIGKTVQYSICQNIPVYVYDHFNGPGYLNLNNFIKCRYHNFSGRGFDKKEIETIVYEIINGYSDALTDIQKIHTLYAEEFILSKKLEKILDNPPQIRSNKENLNSFEAVFYRNIYSTIQETYFNLIKHIHSFNQVNAQLTHTQKELVGAKEELAHTRKELSNTHEELAHTRKELSNTHEELAHTRKEISAIKSSKTYIFASKLSKAKNKVLSIFK